MPIRTGNSGRARKAWLICKAHSTGASAELVNTSAMPSPVGSRIELRGCFRFADGIGIAHNLIELVQRFGLFINQQFRVTDDVNEKNVRDLEAQFRLRFVRQ